MFRFLFFLAYRLGLVRGYTPPYVGVYNNKETSTASVVYITPEGLETLERKYGLTDKQAIWFECKRTNNGERVSVIPTTTLPKNHDRRNDWWIDHNTKQIIFKEKI